MSKKELEKEQIKQIVYDYMFQSVTPEIEDQIEFDNHFNTWWEEYKTKEIDNE
jgi:hypothetical protein